MGHIADIAISFNLKLKEVNQFFWFFFQMGEDIMAVVTV